MSSTPQSPLQRWLEAERLDRPDAEREAEAALMELFEALPLLSPSAGFADRVLLGAGFPPVAARAKASLFASVWVRGLLAACLGVVTLAVLAVPALVQVAYRLSGMLTLSKLVQGGIDLGTEALVALASALRVGEWLVAFGRALTLPLLTPPVSGALLVCLLVSGISLFVLRDLISRQRSWNHVDS